MRPIEPQLDHLVYATTDLGDAVDHFERETGVSPVPGGRHLGLGTRNYLVGLGPLSYLEIIGPDVENPVPAGTAMPFGLDRLPAPGLITWAVHPPDLHRALLASRAAGADLGRPRAMKRQTSSGELLQWQLASTVPAPFGGVTPFLIDWGSTAHPAADPNLPRVCLLEFGVVHPDTAAVRRVFDALEIDADLTRGEPALRAVFDTPQGQFVLD